MTIPTRQAPPIPSQETNRSFTASSRKAQQSRYTPTTDWDDQPFRSAWDAPPAQQQTKKPAPPRPPPPKVKPLITTKKSTTSTTTTTARKPSSNTILSNIMSRARLNKPKVAGPKLLAPQPPGTYIRPSASFSSSASSTPSYTDKQLITFDSPPGSPTFTQKSNSDCVSVDSFSSDSNYSPNNGFSTESGFEDDFVLDNFKPYKRMTPVDPFDMLDEAFTVPPPSRPQIAQIPVNVVGNASFYAAVSVSSSKATEINQETLCNGKDLIAATPARTGPTIIRAVIKKSQAPKPIVEKPHQESSFDETPPSPPMPSCPPPPPPREFFDEGETEESYGVGLYDFNGEQDGDLPFREGEKIYLVRKVNNEWLFGRNRRGCEGIFPASFIDIKVPIAADGDLPQSRGSTPTCDASKVYLARALFDFNAETSEDLSLRVNDEIRIISAINEEWLVGEIGNRRGQFPASYVEYL